MYFEFSLNKQTAKTCNRCLVLTPVSPESSSDLTYLSSVNDIVIGLVLW